MWIARHAESTWNAEGRWQGQGDPPLSRLGERQAEALAEKLAVRGVHTLISSDLARNVEIYDLALQEIVHRAQEPTVWHLPDALRRTVLFDRATMAAYLV